MTTQQAIDEFLSSRVSANLSSETIAWYRYELERLIMGHANITTTEKYSALNLNDVVKKHHTFTLLRSAHAAAQERFVLEQAEAILERENLDGSPNVN